MVLFDNLYCFCFRYFSYLSQHGDRMKFDLAQAAAEARYVSLLDFNP